MVSSSLTTGGSSLAFGTALLWLGAGTESITKCHAYISPSRISASNHPAFVLGHRYEKPSASSSSCLHQSGSSNDELKNFGLNELETLLREAVVKEDFMDAAAFSDELFERLYGGVDGLDVSSMTREEKKAKKRRMSWRGQGAAPWLVDRLDALNYTLPTTIQINTMESVNQILKEKTDGEDEEEDDEMSMEEKMAASGKDMGIVVSGSTGSGKTLAFLVPLLSTLSDSLFARQRIRIGAEESVGDFSGDLVERISVVTSPAIQSNARKPLRPGAIAIGASNPNPTLGKSGEAVDVKSPLALIVVPSRELGVQIAMLLYELVGGSIKKDPN